LTRGTGAALAALAAVTALRLAVAALAPVSPDEAYYWVWSHALAPGYLDAPPMVALWIRAGTALFGPTALGIRLLGPLSGAAGSVLLARAAEDLFPGRHAGIAAAALLNATLLFGVGGIIITPDTPLLFFWTATLWAIARLIRTGNPRWWLAAGLLAGLAMDSKYTAALLVAGIGLWALAIPAGRRWLSRPESWIGLALAFLVVLPVILWNADHHWASFLKQGGRVGAWQPARAVQFQGELLGGQIGLATPLVFAICVAGTVAAVREAWRTRDPAWTLLAMLIVLPAAVFIQHALGGRVQGNWPAILYPAAAIAGAALPGWRRWLRPAVALGAALTLVVYVQAVAAPFPLPARMDPTLLRLGGWPGLARAVAAQARKTGATFVAADEYGLAAELALYLPNLPVVGVAPRWALFRLPPPHLAGQAGLMLRTTRRRGGPDPAPWRSVARTGTLARTRRGLTAETYKTYRVLARAHAPTTRMLP